MLKVQTPANSHTGVVAGVHFVDGVGHVDETDQSAIRYFQRHGYQIGPDIESDIDFETPDYTNPLDDYSVPELRAYAKAHGVDLSGLRTKTEIRAKIDESGGGEEDEEDDKNSEDN